MKLNKTECHLIFLVIGFFLLSNTSKSQEINLSALDTIESNQEKLDYIGKTINAQVYSNPKNIAVYAQLFDSISKITVTPENTANALNYKGVAHYVTQEYDLAIEFYLKATRQLEVGTNDKKLSQIFNNLATCYNIRNDFENTEKYFLKSLNLATKIKDLPWIAHLNNNLSVLYMNNKMYEKADAMIENALVYYKTQSDSLRMGISYMNYGNSKIYSEDYPNAIQYYKKAKTLVNYNKIPLLYAVTETGIGIALTKQKEYKKALPLLTKGLKIAKKIKHEEQTIESYTALADYYSETQDYKNAYLLSIESQKHKDSVLTTTQDQNMANALTKYQTEKKDTELKLLKVEGEKNQQKEQLYLILAIGGLIILGLLGYFGYKNKLKNKQLNTQNSLLERTIDDKNVLLQEVHHRVKNSFQIVSSLLYLQSENVTDEKAKLAIKEAENRVRSMVLVHQKLYKKDELVGINSKEYISDLAKDIFESHHIKKEAINYNLNVEAIVLDIETITPLGLILNELIINTMKHAFQGNEHNNVIDIDFSKVNDELVLKVSDNGKGFEGDIKQTSFGITLMKALSKQLKANLNYISKPSEGTQAILSISKYKILS